MKKRKIPGILLLRTGIGRRLVEDVRFRTAVSVVLSFSVNTAYALYYGIFGMLNSSLFSGSLCGFYLILAFLRSFCMFWETSEKGGKGDGDILMILTGMLFITLAFMLAEVLYVGISSKNAATYGTAAMIAIAAYVFFKIALSVSRAVRRNKDHSAFAIVARNICHAEAAASVVPLQRSMISSFGGMNEATWRLLDFFSGISSFLFIAALGFALVLSGCRMRGDRLEQ